ncbi:MAG: AAA family ATPase [Treponemataceae bacterium]|nr:AAA family ATPase [Treponemataceae bacterium]
MEKLKIKNFGAVGAGLEENDGFIEIGKMTVFLGEQGSGKSTIAKLLSTFLWLEKAFLRGDFSDEEITYEVFVKKYLAWQTIETYIHDNSELEFIGTKYRFLLKDKMFSICLQEGLHISQLRLS